MGSLCLSSASILRCDSLTRIQNIYLIIPTALEVIFSLSLVFIDRGPGKRNLLLAAEGLSFFTLAVLELLAQILPAVRGNLGLFKAFDLAIGITSILPISLYTIFLYLLTNAEIVSALPRRIKTIAKLALVLFIPAIITFNEIASFIGVSTRNIPVDQTTETVVAIGFSSSAQQGLWTFFTSLTLALLTGFQVIVFCFAFFRLTQAVLDQRKIESQRSDKVHLIKGIGWVTGSLNLGVVETIVGFAGGEFGVAITRRILRLLARASLCIGVAKGVDLVEDFRAMRNDPFMAKFRRSQIHDFISNPRLSTFRQLSPKATTFHSAPQASYMYEKSATHRTLTTAGLPGMGYFANVKANDSRQRVTVQYDRGAPSLHMRFSVLDIPNPATIVEEIKSLPHSQWGAHSSRPRHSFQKRWKSVFRDSADSVTSFAGPFELVATPRRMLSQRSARAQLYQAATSGESPPPDPTTVVEPRNPGRVQSMKSIADSLQAVRDLAGQFPGPPMAFKDQNTFIKPSVWEEMPIEAEPTPQALGSPSELIFEEPPNKGIIVLSDDESGWSSKHSSPVVFSDNGNTRTSRQPILYTVTGTPLKSALGYSEKPIDPFNDDDEDNTRLSYTVDKKTPRFRQVNLQDPEDGTGDVIDMEAALDFRQFRPQKLQPSRQGSLHKHDEKIARTAEWIGSKSKGTKLPQADKPTKILGERDMSEGDIPFSRVKSIGKAPRKSTPLPVQASANRGSMHLQPIIIPPRDGNMPVIVDEHEHGSLESTTTGGGILKDSEVLGTGDNSDAKGGNYF